MTTLTKRLGLWLFIGMSLMTLTGFGCRRSADTGPKTDKPLVMWGLWHDSATVDPLVRAFKEQTGIEVEYKKIASVADYERMLLEALAQGRGPDIFVIHHTWVEGKRGIMIPAPADLVDERAVREEFVDVVAQDVVRDGVVYALPASVDTLGLYYNRDLLSAAGIARAPQTWVDLQQAIPKLTQVNRIGTIERSGIALGTGANVNRVGDIIQILMLQSGLPILDPQSQQVAMVNEVGKRALQFYTDFANKAKKTYSWDLLQDYSIDAFAEGDTAMMINYSYHLPTIKAKNPRLAFAVAPLPQNVDSKIVNFASYWPFAVANTTKAPAAAWTFVRFLTSNQAATQLNEAQNVPPARKDGVVQLQRDPELGVFAEQALSATSWPRIDITATDKIFAEMVDSVVTGVATVDQALQRGQDRLNQLYKSNAQP
jgi:multiple sugar transport system substrate-binding protein